MWYTKNLRLAQSASKIEGPNIEASKSLAHQMLRKDYNTLKTAIEADNYVEIPQENKLWIQIDTKDDKSIFEGTLSEIIKQVLANDKYKLKVKNSNPPQAFDPAALASYQSQQPTDGKKTINPLLISPYGNKKMPGYAIIGTKEKTIEESKNDDLEKNKNDYLNIQAPIVSSESLKKNNSDFQDSFVIPGSLFTIYIYGNDEVSLQKIKNKLNEFSRIKDVLVDNVYKPQGVNSTYSFFITEQSFNANLATQANITYTKEKNNFENNNIKELYEKEQYDILTVYFTILNSLENLNFRIIVISDERTTSRGFETSLFPPFKPTYFPIRVESAIYTYSDKLPVDIYLNNKLIRKGFPNNSYFKLDPREFELTKGPHELKILDNRPGMPQNIVQSRIQRFEFRLEPEKEAIVFNAEPNRIIR